CRDSRRPLFGQLRCRPISSDWSSCPSWDSSRPRPAVRPSSRPASPLGPSLVSLVPPEVEVGRAHERHGGTARSSACAGAAVVERGLVKACPEGPHATEAPGIVDLESLDEPVPQRGYETGVVGVSTGLDRVSP